MGFPFSAARASRAEWAQRWRDHPASGALALRLEHTAIALNPRMKLFGANTAWDLAVEHGLTSALDTARRHLGTGRCALYEVRRAFTAPARALRSIRILAEGPRTRMHAALAHAGGRRPQADRYGIRRVRLRPATDTYPRVEHLLVVAPAGVQAKQRPAFERTWQHLAGHDDAPQCDGVG